MPQDVLLLKNNELQGGTGFITPFRHVLFLTFIDEIHTERCEKNVEVSKQYGALCIQAQTTTKH